MELGPEQDGLLPSNLVRVNKFGAPARSLLVSKPNVLSFHCSILE